MLEFPFYQPGNPLNEPAELPLHKLEGTEDPAGYQPDEGLTAAVNVALLLGNPLLLTGEPGTGKTLLAYHLARYLKWEPVLLFEAKSTSTARDLFFTYDALGRFESKGEKQSSSDPRDYITYNALGKAILRTRQRSDISRYVPAGYEHDGPRRSVVLIDEVDKAPRDFPNDILAELENRYFKVPQIDNEPIVADHQLRPVVVITSNSEKNLPAPFLRRCAYYHIPPPDAKKLVKILEKRVQVFPGSALYRIALSFYTEARKANMEKPPATAELIAWVVYLKEIAARGKLSEQELFAAPIRRELDHSLTALVKSKEDRELAYEALKRWVAIPLTERLAQLDQSMAAE
jgi:MoxR-like ATPase